MTFSLIHDEPSGVHGCHLRAWSSTTYSHCAYEEVMRKLVNGLRFLGMVRRLARSDKPAQSPRLASASARNRCRSFPTELPYRWPCRERQDRLRVCDGEHDAIDGR